MHTFTFRTSSKKGVTTSVHVTGETLDCETKTDNHKVADDLVDQEEIGGDDCAIDEEIGIDCGIEGAPGQLTCYGRSVTTNFLKNDEETNKLKQKHADEITSLKEEMNETREEMRHFFSQLLQKNLD
ncbi:hypothetical protein RDI58_017710 [Solanum bulbocastanum]|uniref:Uncharacterized protein n=1 Tax=Solanum bulbocastanum TaxID=147425 RepID=A0AAN8YA84_SOLBU